VELLWLLFRFEVIVIVLYSHVLIRLCHIVLFGLSRSEGELDRLGRILFILVVFALHI